MLCGGGFDFVKVMDLGVSLRIKKEWEMKLSGSLVRIIDKTDKKE